MLTPAEAEALIRQHVTPLPPESVALSRLAGRVLRQDVHGERDQPPFHRVTMDGIAFASAVADKGARRFPVLGIQAAGARPLTLSDTGGCLEVMTGASLPEGCDCVVPVEKITVVDGVAELDPAVIPVPWMNVQKQGWDAQVGQLLLQPGAQLDATHVAVIASAGLAAVQVTRLPRILIVTTGDELIEAGVPIEAWQIRRSNAYTLQAALQNAGFPDVRSVHLPDHPEVMRAQLQSWLSAQPDAPQPDVVILSGGVSTGRFDYVPDTLAALGVKQVFHKVAQRPGLPLWFGTREDGRTVYALPGNPVSALVCLLRYVVPGLRHASGVEGSAPASIALGEDFAVKPALTYFLPVAMQSRPDGGWQAVPRTTHGSGDFISLLGTQGFVELPSGPATVPAGAVVPFYSWSGQSGPR